MKGVLASGEKGLLQIVAATHAGLTTDEFNIIVKDWLKSARHPKFNRPYNECVYQPMLELLTYLRANGFKTFIVSGGGVEFMRAFAEQTYGIPPEQVVGSSGVVTYEMRDGKPALIKQAKIEFIDDGPGKPVGINRFIGRRPVMAFGNSDGDQQMLEWTTAGDGARFAPHRSSHRRRTRGRLRQGIAHRQARQSPGRSCHQGLDSCEYEGRLEDYLPTAVAAVCSCSRRASTKRALGVSS